MDIVDWEGSPVVMELELIEPSLFLDGGPQRVARLVEAVRGELGRLNPV
ncbi:MAG: hypothetical protein ABI083_10000 [Lapillicoccus sp.]